MYQYAGAEKVVSVIRILYSNKDVDNFIAKDEK
jgi:hypothetical protein